MYEVLFGRSSFATMASAPMPPNAGKARKYVSIADISRATAFRDLEGLVKNGLLLVEGEGTGRGTRYNLALPGWEWRPADTEKRGLTG
jgi:hypothetical protein